MSIDDTPADPTILEAFGGFAFDRYRDYLLRFPNATAADFLVHESFVTLEFFAIPAPGKPPVSPVGAERLESSIGLVLQALRTAVRALDHSCPVCERLAQENAGGDHDGE